LKTFHDKMAHRRKQRGLSQADLGSLVNLSRPTISCIEAGNSEVTLKAAVRIAKILNINLNKIPIGTIDKNGD